MISVQNVSLQFGGQYLFEGISFSMKEGQRTGLVGKNGAGKSTLLKLLFGDMEADQGDIVIPRGETIGYLKQELVAMKGKTVFEEASSAFDESLGIEKRMQEIEVALSERTDTESKEYADLLNELQELSHHYELMDIATIDKQVELVLSGLGFLQEDLAKPVETFSGGWQMRIELAKILLSKPNLVLLDEPTNHLDIESIQWLEKYLLGYPGSILLVSHDRSFLDNVTNRTIEITNGRIYDYPAPYTTFMELRKERIEQQTAAARNQEKMIDHTEQLIEKFRYKASKAKFAQTLINKLDKMEKIEIDEEENASIQFRFPQPDRSGKAVLKVESLSKSYGDKLVLKDIDLLLERGDKVALVGRNGEGKSTLSRVVSNLEPFEGSCTLGHNVTLSYYAQNQADMMSGQDTVFDVIDNVATGDIRTRIRNLLAAFLFRGDDIYKKVSVLSGGEKSRLALCRMLLQPANFLILDEPTNHLDMRSKDVLKQALLNFQGTVMVVSHDRDFLKGLTNKIIEVANKNVKEYIGDIYDFIDAKGDTYLDQSIKSKASEHNKGDSKQKEDFLLKKEKEKRRKKIENAIKRSEKEIETQERRIEEIESKLKDPEFFKKLAHNDPIYEEYESLKTALNEQMETWSAYQEELETLLDE